MGACNCRSRPVRSTKKGCDEKAYLKDTTSTTTTNTSPVSPVLPLQIEGATTVKPSHHIETSVEKHTDNTHSGPVDDSAGSTSIEQDIENKHKQGNLKLSATLI